jgi:hypothetical protein
MWFPDGDQRNVEGIRIVAASTGFERHVNVVSAGYTPRDHWQFVGTFNREHGVIAGILTFEPGDVAGISGDYVGVHPIDIDGQGFFRPVPRARIPTGEGPALAGSNFVNRFIALDFGVLDSNESKSLSYTRIMTVLPPEQRSEDGIHEWVRRTVTAIQGVE